MTEEKREVSAEFKERISGMPLSELKGFCGFLRSAHHPNRILLTIEEELNRRAMRVTDETQRRELEEEFKQKFFEEFPQLQKENMKLDVAIVSRQRSPNDIEKIKWFVRSLLHVETEAQYDLLQEVRHDFQYPEVLRKLALKHGLIFHAIETEETYLSEHMMDAMKKKFLETDQYICHAKKIDSEQFQYFLAGWQAHRSIRKKMRWD